MKKIIENIYNALIKYENFYIVQYYSEFHKEDRFIAIKELIDGLYCVLISDEKNIEIDYAEAVNYAKSLGKNFSINMMIFTKEDYTHVNYEDSAFKLIINEKNNNVVYCDEACKPLFNIFQNLVKEEVAKGNFKIEKLTKNKMTTYILIAINIIMFIITQIAIMNLTNSLNSDSGQLSTQVINAIQNSVFITFGAKYNVLIGQGEVWRLLTCAFLHANFIHIACNMYSLLILGPQIDKIYGWKNYLFIYLFSCITSSTLSYVMSPSISVGASGGIFGLMGALLAFAFIERNRIDKRSVSSLMQIIIINLFIGLSIKNIDNFGHIGGLIGGFIISNIIYKKIRK